MRIGVPREIHAGEKRVATTPEVAAQLIELGFAVAVEKDAGSRASFSDRAYRDAGCDVVDGTKELWDGSDIVLKVRAPEGGELAMLRADQTFIRIPSCSGNSPLPVRRRCRWTACRAFPAHRNSTP